MIKNLCTWELPNVWQMTDELSLKKILKLAQSIGYGGIQIKIETINKLVQEKSIDYVKGLFPAADIIPAGWMIHDAWRLDENPYRKLLEDLPSFAKTSGGLGCRCCYIWVPNWSDERDYAENFKWHIKRLRPIVSILKDYNLRLGLEWQGTKTLRVGRKYEFIHDMKGMLELVEKVNQDNTVGLLLDSWHWYTSYGTVEKIKSLKGDQVVHVHICDAPKDIPVDEQLDLVREVPGETGIIDLVGFLKSLAEIGYNGPVEPSVPGSKTLENMSVEEAARMNYNALVRLWQSAGIVENR